MSSIEHEVDVASPLENAGILLHVLDILGPGHHLFISAVSKAWRESYKRVAAVQMLGLIYDYNRKAAPLAINSQTTLFSAVFASTSRVNLAHECGLTFDNARLQRLAGRVGEVPTLRAAQELGLQLTDAVLIGAAESASVPKLRLLRKDLQVDSKLPYNINFYAARSGSVDMLC
jgi:hypothetical protein